MNDEDDLEDGLDGEFDQENNLVRMNSALSAVTDERSEVDRKDESDVKSEPDDLVIEYPTTDPLEKIMFDALRMCDLSRSRAFAIDSVNLGKKLGEYVMARVFEIFTDRVYKDTDEEFSAMFQRVSREDLAQNLADYLLQRIGGEPYYSGRKGTPELVCSHAHLALNTRLAERWLEHFENTLEDVVDDIPSQSDRQMLFDHVRFQAYYLVAAQKHQKEHGLQGIHFLDD